MSFVLVLLIGVLFGIGTHLLLQRSLTQIVLGIGVLANGVNMLILATGTRQGTPPIVEGNDPPFTDPVPQALVLTAIVIGFALTAFLAALAWRLWTIDGNDLVEDDIEDRMIARRMIADHHRDIRDREDVEYDAYYDGSDICNREDVDIDTSSEGNPA
jgi:multicomponent Na+:H+ antiporter subunit C